ncbi:MAG: acyltransferase [Clostridium sp.]|nr:acyltransferase [Clostridium sp.]MCM1444554.1 hypothetical protein [Candidatus Amulumruptor caecigallinarius]
MQNIFINKLNEKDVDNFTSNFGLFLRKKSDKPFKKACNIFTNANIIRTYSNNLSDEEYFSNLDTNYIPPLTYNLKKDKNNIILERYPNLNKNEPYIFVCNHTCPEDIETVLNVLDRNSYLILGSIESLKYNKEMYLTWLNGMIPFDILDGSQRKELIPKMERVLKTNSILIFPEGSHNYSPNKIINNIFDGPINLSLTTGRKIVIVTLIKDDENNVSYIDVSNPINLETLDIDVVNPYLSKYEQEKFIIKNMSKEIRDKMATAAYYIICRHFDIIKRSEYLNIEEYFRNKKIEHAFEKLKWAHDVFDAEYLVKKTQQEKEYEEVIKTLSELRLDINVLKTANLDSRYYIKRQIDLQNKDVARRMREYWYCNLHSSNNEKQYIKKR